MSRTRLYVSDAQRQAAYRLRRTQTDKQCLTVPDPNPAVVNPWPRWRRLAGNAAHILSALQTEMEEYQDARSERWQESDKADEFTDRLDAVTELLEQTKDWIADR